MKRQQKKYSRPQRPFDKVRIQDENILKEKYGLKNKKEIWKADAAIGRIRNLAKQLITASEEDKNAFVERLQARGFAVESIADALALNKEDWLKRRLQTVLLSKGLTTTSKQARQLITHKHVIIGDQVVNIPSYMVSTEEEPMVKLDIVLKMNNMKSKEQEIKEEVLDRDDKEFVKDVSKSNDENVVDENIENEKDIGSSTNDARGDSSDNESREGASIGEEIKDDIPENLGDRKAKNVLGDIEKTKTE
jgi:small subunit ribosomal protein S4